MNDGPLRGFKSFREFGKFYAETYPELGINPYPQVVVGSVWWVPSDVLRLGERLRHPWVVVTTLSPGTRLVRVCPRSTRLDELHDQFKLYTPANLLPGLDKEGLILLGRPEPLPISTFDRCELIGVLDQEWMKRLSEALSVRRGRVPWPSLER